MEEMSAVGIPPSSLQGGINSVFRNKHLILEAFYVELTLKSMPCLRVVSAVAEMTLIAREVLPRNSNHLETFAVLILDKD